jgi:hypothetical protein
MIITKTGSGQTWGNAESDSLLAGQSHAVMPGFNPYLRSDTMDVTPKAYAKTVSF